MQFEPVEEILEPCRHIVPVYRRGNDDRFCRDHHLVERRHVVELVPARVAARVVPHGITAPAVVDGKFIDIIPPVTHPLLTQDLLGKIRKVAGVVGPVIAAIDQQHIKLFPVIAKRFLFGKLNKLPAGAGALRTFCGRALRTG